MSFWDNVKKFAQPYSDDEYDDYDEEDDYLEDYEEPAEAPARREKRRVAPAPVKEEIEEEDVPLGDLPKTADPIILYAGMAALSGAGLVLLKGKKEDEEEA